MSHHRICKSKSPVLDCDNATKLKFYYIQSIFAVPSFILGSRAKRYCLVAEFSKKPKELVYCFACYKFCRYFAVDISI